MIPGALNFDELNKLVVNKRAVPYEEYFGGMDLTEEECEERIGLAEQLESSFLPVMALLFMMQLYDRMNWEQIQQNLEDAYTEALAGYVVIDDRLREHISQFSQDIVLSTRENMDDPYFFSMDRAQFMAENESNTSFEYGDFSKAVKSGKTRKTWKDVRDKKERDSHIRVGGTTKSIWDPFEVGDSLMMYPKDDSLGAGPEELVNCRCHAVYF